jgi:hypothetical protein
MYKTYYTLMSNLDLLRDATNKELLESYRNKCKQELELRFKKEK